MIIKDKTTVFLATTPHPKIEVVGEEEMRQDETCKIVGDVTMVHRRDEGVMTIISLVGAGVLVAILRIEEGRMPHLQEEDDMMKTIVATAAGTTVITEEIGLMEIGPVDPLVEITTGVVKGGEGLEETIIEVVVVVDLVLAAEVVGDDVRMERIIPKHVVISSSLKPDTTCQLLVFQFDYIRLILCIACERLFIVAFVSYCNTRGNTVITSKVFQ